MMCKKLLSSLIIAIATWFLVVAPVLAGTHIIKMGTDSGMLKFEPETITIKPGDTVKWVNSKLAPHNTVFNVNKVPENLVEQLSNKHLLYSLGDSYETIFPEDVPPGEYPYYCQPHRGAGMVGKIIVE